MDRILREMTQIWRVRHIDWLGYILHRKSELTYHHIKKFEYGGGHSIDNGAPLISLSHAHLHLAENLDYDIYLYINGILKEVNEQRCRPTLEQLMLINDAFQRFEKEYSGRTNSKNKCIIKPECVFQREKGLYLVKQGGKYE